MNLRCWIFHVLEVEPEDRGFEQFVNIALLLLIVLNVIAVVLETVGDLKARWEALFWTFEVFSVGVFTVEYLLRLWSCPENARFEQPVTGRLRWALTPMALVDLVAILPIYLGMTGVIDLRYLRVLRLMRLLRGLKIARYSDALQTLGTVVRGKKEDLAIAGVLGVILLTFASSSLYFLEHERQPEDFSSIPAAMWWGISTLTTVGYGDIFPKTTAGKLVGGLIQVLGVAMFALPTAILGAGFVEEIRKRKEKHSHCPHCGGELHS